MATPPQQPVRRTSGESKKVTPPASSIVTRNAVRRDKMQLRSATVVGAKPTASAVLLAAKKKSRQKKKHNIDTPLRDHYQIAMESKHKVKGPTGLVTEPRMAEHRCLWDGNYPENPERLTSIIKRCEELDLISQCVSIPPRPATREELESLHCGSLVDMMEATEGCEDADALESLSSKFDAIYIHPSTHEMALLAAGAAIDLVTQIVSGRVQNGAALVRPPGHHAMRAEPCGYCFYNNVALAAKHAVDNLGLERVLIVDWDVHHGQATQQMFYEDPRVVYFSVHRYEHGAFWPGLRQADWDHAGAGRGEGYTFNVPLNRTGMGDADYLAVWHQLLLPMAFEGEMEVTPACYATLTHLLLSVSPALAVVLEGGYWAPSLAEGAALTLRTLLGRPPPRRPRAAGVEPSDEIRDTILNCIYAHRAHWRCYRDLQPAYSLDTGVRNVCDWGKEKHTVALRWEGDETRPDTFDTRDCYPVQSEPVKRSLAERFEKLMRETDLSVPQYEVAYLYDDAMLKHRNPDEPDHVECPERIQRVHARHAQFGLLARVTSLPPRAAADAEITAVHTQDHLDRLKSLYALRPRELAALGDRYESVYFHRESLASARVALGCVLEAVAAVRSGAAGAATCVVRPPGHHAAAEPAGFCLLNAAAAAARAAAATGDRVLLVDWDVHHGNGTQELTYDSDQILYVSLHRYEGGSFFPHSTAGAASAAGAGRGRGYNVNIPWNKRGMGDREYLAAFTQVVLPVGAEFQPDLVVVSAGFDACVGDPLGGCLVSPECYGVLTRLLRSLAGGRVVLVLEGGYNVAAVAAAMTICTKALLGDPITYSLKPDAPLHWSAVETLNEVIATHKKYWKSLKFQVALPIENVLEPPAASRGLGAAVTDLNLTALKDRFRAQRDSKLSLSRDAESQNVVSSEESFKSASSSLADCMENMSIRDACVDGVHCAPGDDDADPSRPQPRPPSPTQPGGSGTQPGASSSSEPSSSSQPGPSSSSQPQPTQTLADFLAENMQAIVQEEMFAVVPLRWCPHLEALPPLPAGVRFEPGAKCVACDHTEENWVCLHCFVTACARGVRGHMQRHHAAAGHALSLSLLDLSVWCSACDAYVDHRRLYAYRNNAHICKFGEPMPWCYGDEIEMQ